MNLKILVATHKKYQMPLDEIYLPLHVGKEGKEFIGYEGDDTGDNISLKNSNYCELTGLYWAWKNLDCEYIGLCHYRRYFSQKKLFRKNKKFDMILNKNEIEKIMKQYDLIVPKKRNYYIETVYTHYKNAHYEKDLLEIKNIIFEKYPEFLESFNEIMNGKTMYLYNMFIMEKNNFDDYCEWLFDILFELENRVNISEYDTYQKRIFGFLSERLFNIWILQKKIKLKEVGILNIEKVEWGKKIFNFINRKVRK